MKNTPEYKQGYHDAIHGKQVAWMHLMDSCYLAGYDAGRRMALPKHKRSFWDILA